MQTIGLVGFGVSNYALYEHFKEKYKIFVHNEHEISLPSFATPCFGENYLDCNEDIVFRSPSVRPEKIRTSSPVFCEASYALSKMDCKKILVSGSDGKTTTSTLIYNILSQAYKAYLGGNIGAPLIKAIYLPLDFLVAELSSFQLYDSFPKCDVAVLTNITENHLNWHTDMDEYIASKEKLLKNANKIVLSYDNEILRKIGKKYKNVCYFSAKESLRGLKGCAYIHNDFFYYESNRLFSTKEIKLKGEFNYANVLASIVASAEYTSTEVQKNAICAFGGVENRLELVKAVNGVNFYNSSIDSTPSRTIATLSAMDKEKCIIILGGSDKNLSYEPLKKALCSIKAIIVLGENKKKILSCLPISSRAFVVNDLSEAVYLAYKLAKVGESVLLSPASCSFDMYKSYKERGLHFKELVNKLNENNPKEESIWKN